MRVDNIRLSQDHALAHNEPAGSSLHNINAHKRFSAPTVAFGLAGFFSLVLFTTSTTNQSPSGLSSTEKTPPPIKPTTQLNLSHQSSLSTNDTSNTTTPNSDSATPTTNSQSSNSQSSTSVTVNGQSIAVPPNGTAHQVINNGSSQTTIDVSHSSSSSSTTGNTSTLHFSSQTSATTQTDDSSSSE